MRWAVLVLVLAGCDQGERPPPPTYGGDSFIEVSAATVTEMNRAGEHARARGPWDVNRFEETLATWNASAPGPCRAYIAAEDNGGSYVLLKLSEESFRALTTPRADGLVIVRAHAPRPGPMRDPGDRRLDAAAAKRSLLARLKGFLLD